MFRFPVAAALFIAAAPAAWSLDAESAMKAFHDASIAGWASDPLVIGAIVDQNRTTAGYDAATIDALDQAWRAEVGAGETPTIDPVTAHPASDFLRARVAEAGGAITEIFVMDQVGLNVAASGVTSDYWQGDEEKFTATYGAGPGSIHYSEIEFDESSQTYQAQISFPLADPASGELVGAMTVGVNAESLM